MKKVDCLLVNPRSAGYSKAQKAAPYLPAGLLSIASVLQAAGHGAYVLDMVVEDEPAAALDRYRVPGQSGVLLAGFTVMTTQLRHAAELSAHVRAHFPGTKIIWGGIHPSMFPEQVLREGFADFVCAGEGEYAALELLEALKAGGDGRSVKGLYYLSGEELVFTGRRAPNDLDKLPFLDYGLIDYESYRARTVFRGSETMNVNMGVIVSSVGCPYRCAFCVNVNKRLAFGGYRSKSAARLADEIEHLITRFGVNYFDFLDENFFVRRDHAENFAAEVQRRGLKFRWRTNMRADAASRGLVDEELLGRLTASGLYLLAVGAESGSQRVLGILKKDIKVEQIVQTAELASRHGLGVIFSFMMGIPGETSVEVGETLRLIQRLRALDPKVSIIGPQVFRPYPGGELYDDCVSTYGYKAPANSDEWAESLDILTGYDDVEKLPWIKDKEFINKVSFYLEFANINIDALPFGPLKRLVFIALRAAAGFRIRFQFWGLGLDRSLILWYKKSREKRAAA